MPTFKLVREREPGTPWELGDRLFITYTDEQGTLGPTEFICTGTEDGRIVEAVSRRVSPRVHLSFEAEKGCPR